MKRISDAQAQRMAQREDVDLAALAAELIARLAEYRFDGTTIEPTPDPRTLLERLEAER